MTNPFMGIIYGNSGDGKTCLALAMMPNAICLGKASACVDVVRDNLSFIPAAWPPVLVPEDRKTSTHPVCRYLTELETKKHPKAAELIVKFNQLLVTPNDLEILAKILEWLQSYEEATRLLYRNNKERLQVIIDDASILTTGSADNNADKAVLQKFGAVADDVQYLIHVLQGVQFDVLITTHMAPSGITKANTTFPAKPKLGSSFEVKHIELAHFVLPLLADPNNTFPDVFAPLFTERPRMLLSVKQDEMSKYIIKNRWSAFGYLPPSLREMAIATDRADVLSRPAGLEFLDELTTVWCAKIIELASNSDKITKAHLEAAYKYFFEQGNAQALFPPGLAAHVPPGQAVNTAVINWLRWASQDAAARAVYMKRIELRDKKIPAFNLK